MIDFNPPTSFHIGPLDIHVWGLMVGLGVALAVWTAYEEAQRRNGVLSSNIVDAALWGVLGAFAGARIFYFIDRWDSFIADPVQLFRVWDGGLALYGGIIGAVIAITIYTRLTHTRTLEVLDLFAFALPVGIFVGRLGCLSIHDHRGLPTDAPWGFFIDGQVRHEPALYLSLMGLVLFVIFLWFRKTNPRRFTGFYIAAFLFLYGMGRFVIDFTRESSGPASDPHFYGLSLAQYFSVGSIVVSMGLILYLRHRSDHLLT